MSAPNVEQYLGLVAAIALRLAEQLPVTVDVEDLKQAGAIGLLDAVAKFDSSAGVNFSTYARFRIRGAMLDSLRELDWMTRDGRRMRKRIEQIIDALRGQLGRDAEPKEIAEALGLTVEQYQEFGQQVLTLVSSDAGTRAEDGETISFDAPSSDPTMNPQWLTEHANAGALLEQICRERLSERYRLVLELYYGPEGLSFAEIGERLGVNESRVSQIHKLCLERIEAGLRERGIHGTGVLIS